LAFQWLSIQHNALSFEVSESVRTVDAQRTEGSRKNYVNRMCLSLQHLLRLADVDDKLNRIVTGDESWVHQYEPELKRASMQWKHPSSPSTKKFKVMSTPSAGNGMLIVFWDSQEVLLARFQKRGANVNSASY
jgi:hypothetical protein